MTDTIIENLTYQKKYTDIYGAKTVVFGKYGDFYDAFEYNPKKCLSESDKIDKYGVIWNEPVGCAGDISELIDCDFTMKNTNRPYGIKNVNLVGFPTIAWTDKVKLLLQNDYVVIKLDQSETEKNEHGNYKRFIGDIISPFMTFDTISVNRIHANTVTITMDYISAKNVHYMDGYMIAVGFASFDLITGITNIVEFYSKENNETYYIEELTRMLSIYYPKDISIYLNNMPNITGYVKYLERILELKRYDRYVVHLNKIAPEHRKLNYQKEFLNKLYEKNSHTINNTTNNDVNVIYKNERIIEELDLSKFNYGRLAFILLAQYCKVQNGPIDNLRLPTVHHKSDYLVLTHNAAVSIEVIPSAHQKCKVIMNSLYAVMEHTCTNIGKRCLENKLLNPMTKMDDIQYHYNMVEEFMQIYNNNDNNNEPLWALIERHLYLIPDFAKLQRRVELRNVSPKEVATILKGYCKLIGIFDFLFSLPVTNTIDLLNKQLDLTAFYQMVAFFDKVDADVLELCGMDKLNCNNGKTLMSFTTNPFKNNDYLNNLFDKLNVCNQQLNSIVCHLSSFVKADAITLSTKNINKKGKISKKNTKYESKNTYLTASLTNANKIVTCKYDVNLCGNVSATPFITKEKIITSDVISGLCQQKDELEKDIGIKLHEYFMLVTEELLSFAKHFTGVCYAVGLLDLIHTYAKISYKNKYYKPTLKDGDSFLKLKELRHPIVEKLIDYEYVTNDFALGKQHVEDDAPYGALMYSINSAGKCFSPDTKLIMYDGTSKEAKDIIIGDQLMGDDSTPRSVLSLNSGEDVMYKIIPNKGEPFIVNGPHILCLKSSGYKHIVFDKKNDRYVVAWFNQNHQKKSKLFSSRPNNTGAGVYGDRQVYNNLADAHQAATLFYNNVLTDEGDIIEISVEDYMKKQVNWKPNYYLYRIGIEFDEQELPINPYILGYWLGDGTNKKPQITTIDREVVLYFKNYAESIGLILRQGKDTEKSRGSISYTITTTIKNSHGKNTFLNRLKLLNVMCNKHIPDIYKFNSRENRLKLLAGIIDSDGANHGNVGFDITLKDKKLLEDIVWLSRSLGFFASFAKCQKTCTNAKNGPKTGTYYRSYIGGKLLKEVPLLLNYKIPVNCDKNTTDNTITSFKIETLDVGPYVGFETDGNKRFLLNDFIVTHNSTNLKAIGLVIIMAQAGCFVPAMMEYHPYERIITRLSTQDNISMGQSSYDVEITELRTILKQGNKSSLVFADELASRTESQSATCITASAIVELINQKASFLFTSHIHEVAKLPDITSISPTLLKICHLAVNYDYETDNLIYNRKIQPGSGTSRYGLDVARYHKLPESFLTRAYKISNYLEQEYDDYLSSKTSHFNTNVVMDHCHLCNSKNNLESHHIKPQKDADQQGYIGNMHKNKKHNMLVLCETCHRKITLENKELKVLQTINGHIIKY